MNKPLLLLAGVLLAATSPSYAATLGTSASVPDPSSSFSATTGLFSTASGVVSISSAGTEVMRVNSTGVGIGTTSPSFNLDVESSSANTELNVQTNTSGNSILRLENNGNRDWTWTANRSTDSLGLTTGGTTTFLSMVGSNGNVGIGIAAPTSLLHTADSSAHTTNYIGVEHSVTATSSTASVNKTGMDIQSTGTWSGTSAVNTGLNVNVSGGTTNYAATFQGGNVGIGTTSPANTLDIGDSGGIHITTGTPSSTSNALYNNSGTLTWNGSALATSTPSSVILSAGQLQCSGASCNSTGSGTIQFCPYKGNIKTTASQGNYTIPSACLTATLTSMYVGGTASLSVAASTLYYIYLWNTSGTWVLDAETGGHATDSTTGIEIKSSDTSKTLVGMIHTDSGKKVMTGGKIHMSGDTNTVATWDNRLPTSTYCGFTANRSTTSSAGFTEVNAENRCNFMSWGDSASFASWQTGSSNTSSAGFATYVGIDTAGSLLFSDVGFIQVTANIAQQVETAGIGTTSEGFHFTVLSAQVDAGTTVTYSSGGTGRGPSSLYTVQ